MPRVDKWVKRWNVQGSEGHVWRVAQDKDGNFGCSCPRWKFKRETCHHIQQVKSGFCNNKSANPQRPTYILAKVFKPKVENSNLLIPLVAIPDTKMMEATICFYLLNNGYSMSEIRELRNIPRDWTAKAIFAHIANYGEAEYPETF